MERRAAEEAAATLADLDVGAIQESGAREAVVRLMHMVELLAGENRTLRETNARLEDELRRLKGQSPRPPGAKGQGKNQGSRGNFSSELERRVPKGWSKSAKVEHLSIDREETVVVDATVLPADAVFKGHVAVVVQDVEVKRDNVRFLKEKWYSPCERRTFLAELPAGYQGTFGPGLRSLATVLYFGMEASEPKIAEFLRNVGITISDGHISDLLIKGREGFHAEADAIREAGLASSPWQHLDTTVTSVKGQTHHTHVLANPLYTAYDTRPTKDRLATIDVLAGWQGRRYLLNDEAWAYLDRCGLSPKRRRELTKLPWAILMEESALEALLAEHVPKLGPTQRRWVKEALAVAAYHAGLGFPEVKLLVCDDAHAFNWVTDELALCWIHEGRHYAKLGAILRWHEGLLRDFRTKFWTYYRALEAYRLDPTEAARQRLDGEFDTLFTTQTGYRPLDDRIALTFAKRSQLLSVLLHPEVPLQNNPAELGARRRVRKRDVSFGPQTLAGLKAWDTFQTLAATAQKLNVSFYHYIHDRIRGSHSLPALADLIHQRTPALNLGSSWATS